MSYSIYAFALLTRNGKTGKPLVDAEHLAFALAGAALADLTGAGKLTLVKRKIQVADVAPVNDAVLDSVLMRIRKEPKARTPRWWIDHLRSKTLVSQVLDELVTRGDLTKSTVRVMDLFPVDRYALRDETESARIRAAIEESLSGGQATGATAATTVMLLDATGLLRKQFGRTSGKTVRSVIEGMPMDIPGAPRGHTASFAMLHQMQLQTQIQIQIQLQQQLQMDITQAISNSSSGGVMGPPVG